MDITKWLIIVAGLTILFSLAGLPTGMGLILERAGINLTDNPENFSISNLIITITTIFAAATVAGIIIGFFAKSSPIPFILAVTYMALLLSFVGDTIAIVTYASANYEPWIAWVSVLILVPISIGYAHALVDWWKS